MIIKEHVPHLQRLAPYFQAPMLMLGRQSNTARWEFPCEYTTLDPDGGDMKWDLNFPTPDVTEWFETVFNLGTLEHVWDVHQAYVNAASAVKIGGHFIGHAPVAGFEGHGIHVTDPRKIMDFFQLNGFVIEESWVTTQHGNPISSITRNGGKSVIQWLVARREVLVDQWRKPSQVYVDGHKAP